MLTGLPALTPLVADYFMESQTAKLQSERYAFWSVVAGVVFIPLVAGFYAWPFSRTYTKDHSLAKEYQAQLALVPRDAVMICGSQTVAVTYWRGLGAGEWDVIGSGSGWPGAKLPSVIAKSLAAGRRIFLDADPRWWSPDGWQQQATVELIDIESRFHFRRVSDTIYEIRPPEDGTARDLPHLSYWLLKKSH